ncbi:lytic transglycosylase domain-containing protein [Candidatus Saccharibacteria bacterium]|nr:lytic transglycosylase domain-containing protein [Candidatus Saccharibacteria bacterium]
MPKRRHISTTQRRNIIIAIVSAVVAIIVIWGTLLMNTASSGTPLTYRTSGVTISWLPESVSRWNNQIKQYAQSYNVDANLVAILMTLESGGYSRADSGVARGLMQVTDYTGGDIASKYLNQPVVEFDLFKPETSIEFGTAYIRYLRDTLCVPQESLSINECVELIAAGYNGGPGAAGALYRGEGLKSVETLSYSRDAMNMWRERNAGESVTYTRWFDRGGRSLVLAARDEEMQ